MTTPGKLNELSAAEDPARELLEKLGWTHVSRVRPWQRSAGTSARCC